MRSDRLRLALRMVWRRPLRSFMAALGLALAMAATLVAVAIAQKGMDRTLAEINAIGANVLTISAQPSRNRGGRVRTGSEVTTLTLADARLIERQVPGVIGIAAEYRGDVPVKFGSLARQPRVAGIEPSYAEIAKEAGLSLSAAYQAYPSKAAILMGIGRDIDARIFAGLEGDPLDGSPKDRLFDLLMRRFDALNQHREAFAALAKDLPRTPGEGLALLCQLRSSLARMLEAAGISASGLRGALRIEGLGAIYAAALRVVNREGKLRRDNGQCRDTFTMVFFAGSEPPVAPCKPNEVEVPNVVGAKLADAEVRLAAQPLFARVLYKPVEIDQPWFIGPTRWSCGTITLSKNTWLKSA